MIRQRELLTPERVQGRRRSRPVQVLLLVGLIGLLPVQAGCYHYRVIAPEPDPATDYEHRRVHAYLWGLLQSDDVEATDCLSNALDEVRITTNLGYAVVSVLTLGIWVPLEVQWRCAKEPSPNGVI